MSYQKGVMTCDGCKVPIDRREAHMTFVPRQSAGAISIPEDYHEACWLTGWYTGIPPKGEFPEPVAVCGDELKGSTAVCTLVQGHDGHHYDSSGNHFWAPKTRAKTGDPVNHPGHYTWLPNNIEVIDITETLNFCLGNAVKYILRADHKGKPEQDLRKARWYINRELERREIANRENGGVV